MRRKWRSLYDSRTGRGTGISGTRSTRPATRCVDRTLVFAIVALSLMIGSMLLVRHYAVPHAAGQFPVAEAER